MRAGGDGAGEHGSEVWTGYDHDLTALAMGAGGDGLNFGLVEVAFLQAAEVKADVIG